MGRIADTFKNRTTPAFIGFTVAGDPDKETCVRIARALIEGGTDILELGYPSLIRLLTGRPSRRRMSGHVQPEQTPTLSLPSSGISGKHRRYPSFSLRITIRFTTGGSSGFTGKRTMRGSTAS